MSTYLTIPYEELVEIPSPHVEPRLAFQSLEPRKVDNLTLIDGKTFSATNVSGDIYPAGLAGRRLLPRRHPLSQPSGTAHRRTSHRGVVVSDGEDLLRAD